MPNLSFRAWLIGLALTASLPLAALLIHEIVEHVRSDYRRVGRYVSGLAAVTANNIAAEVDDLAATLDAVARRPRVRALDAGNCDPHLAEVRKIKRDYADLGTLDADGNVLCSTLKVPGGPSPQFANAPLFRQLKQGAKFGLSGPQQGPTSGRWVIFAGAPISGESGAFGGVIAATIDLAKFHPVAKAALPEGGVVGVIDSRGDIVARSERSEESFGRNVSRTAIGQVVLTERQGLRIMVGNDGAERMYAFRPVAGTGWIVVAGVPSSLLFAPMRASLWRSGIAAAIVVLLSGLAVVVTARRIATPLTVLRDAARRVSGGASQARAPESGPPEVVEVARAFNHMLDRSALMEAELRESEARYRGLFMASPNAVRVVADGVVVMANPAAEALFTSGSDGSVVGRDVMQSIHPDYREKARERIRTVLESGRRLHSEDLVILRGDGGAAPAELVLQPHEYKGRPAVMSIVTDLSERRRLQREVEAQRGTAERLVNEVVARQTASAIAHELNQPLAAVSAYSESALSLLPEAAREPEEMARLLRAAAEQAQRAGHSLIELLDTLHRSELPREAIDLERTLRETPQIQALAGEGVAVVFETQPGLPPVVGHRGQLQRVLGTLLQNGRDAMLAADIATTRRRIVVTLERVADAARVSVRDAGPRIAPEVAERLFQPFFTTKAHGIGIGLSIASALMEAHSGRLWHETAAGEGNTFCFTVPIRA